MLQLLLRWTIKSSESLLKALSANRPLFQSDKNIECVMKESDQWQSYKRDIVSDVLAQKQRTASRIIPQHCIPRILSRAIRHGSTALRHRRRQELFYLPQEGLDRGNHQSHEGTGSNETKSLLKAILLLKKSRGSIHKDTENNVNEKYQNKDGFTEKHARLTSKNIKLENKPKSSEAKISSSELSNIIDVTKSSSSTDVKGRNSEVTPSSNSRILEDRWVINDRRFVIKEVVNTRIPGKSYTAPEAYRRFGPSMFQSLDKIRTLDKARENLKSGQSYYNPGPNPIIVIEKYNETDEETDVESCDNKEENVKEDVYQGSLQTLVEDIEKEHIVENTNKDEWWTAVHETRYESEQCLEKAKQDIAELEQQLVKLGWSREILLAKEKKKRENRMKSGKKNEEVKTEKNVLPVKLEKVDTIKNGRKKRHLKRHDSIQKILEERSLDRPSRRGRHYSEEDEHAKPTLTKQYSASEVQSRKSFQGRQRSRTLSNS